MLEKFELEIEGDNRQKENNESISSTNVLKNPPVIQNTSVSKGKRLLRSSKKNTSKKKNQVKSSTAFSRQDDANAASMKQLTTKSRKKTKVQSPAEDIQL